ncbi:Na(+)/H(+) antiporter subunit C [Schaalia sp. ZJ1691]|uniref:Na(+)/H(+) antiporter subunit C n=1 Tax=Schaalia sp. ZJ1691 TaxID=2709404 RepID=UPI0013ED136F|nr:Na(+)/H(+) antiporter subunit C [Schaalia sp. ZJ1691]
MNFPSLVILLIAGVLVGGGVYLLLERTLTRIFIGLSLITHGVNVLLLASGGAAGRPPLLGQENPATVADPLPQAMMLTSIVLSLGTTAFGLALAYRQWKLTGHDEVVDDIEDRWLADRAVDEIEADEAITGIEDAGINYDKDDEDAPDLEGTVRGSQSDHSARKGRPGAENREEDSDERGRNA